MVVQTTPPIGYTKGAKTSAFLRGLLNFAPLVEVAVAGLQVPGLPREDRLRYAKRVARSGADYFVLLKLLSKHQDPEIQSLIINGSKKGLELGLVSVYHQFDLYSGRLDLFPGHTILFKLTLIEDYALAAQENISRALGVVDISTESKRILRSMFVRCGDTIIDCRRQKASILVPDPELQ